MARRDSSPSSSSDQQPPTLLRPERRRPRAHSPGGPASIEAAESADVLGSPAHPPSVFEDYAPERRQRSEGWGARRNDDYRAVDGEYHESPVGTPDRERRRDTSRDEYLCRAARWERRNRGVASDAETENETPSSPWRRTESATQHSPRRESPRSGAQGNSDTEGESPSPRRERYRGGTSGDSETDTETPSLRRGSRRKGTYIDGEAGLNSPPRERSPRDADADEGGQPRSRGALKPADATFSMFGLKRRVISGAAMEEGSAPAIRGEAAASKHLSSGSYDSLIQEKQGVDGEIPATTRKKMKRNCLIIGAVIIVIVTIAIAVAVVETRKKSSSDDNNKPTVIDGQTESDIPAAARGTYLDPFTWYTTTDFNATYTNQTVGDLPIMGLNWTWDDSAQANENVPALNEDWGNYTSRPARGVNLGGWLSLEPWITPSLFDYGSALGIVDEYTLCSYLGSKKAATLEKHYATFVTESTIREIAAAGLDHVRIQYSYWAVELYDDDPYVFRTSWRYLLRGIEWCRKYGLRVNLDLHGLPGSQNGWNHSGRLGVVGWLNGTDGDLNAERSLDIHDRLSKFFAQDRYKNIIRFYGLANEPRMVNLDADRVVNWTTVAYDLVRANGLNDTNIVFGDGFMGLANWQGKLTNMENLVLDVHQYVIFNNGQIVYTHSEKVSYACEGWTTQTQQSMNTSTGYGPTMFAEWSQADTDCAEHLTNVGWGNRWEGTYDSGNASTDALTPLCPTRNASCSCLDANADPSTFTDVYKEFLLNFAEAQMISFEYGLGWWYWTWDTEDAPLWSYKQGLAAGILPAKAYERKSFNCSGDVPDYAASGLLETY